MTKKHISSLFFLLLLCLGLPAVAFATESPTPRQTNIETRQQIQQDRQDAQMQRQENRQANQEMRQEIRGQRCDVVETSIANRIEHFSTVNNFHLQRYDHVVKTVEAAIERLTALGKDVSGLQAALGALQESIEKYTVTVTDFQSALTTTQQYACGESEGAFLEALNTARQKLLAARAAALAVRTTYQNEVRPALEALRQ